MPNFMIYADRIGPSAIVGGQGAPSPIPWQVSLQLNDSHFCGATILNHITLLSAGHCLYNQSVNGLSIRAGSTEKSFGGQVKLQNPNGKIQNFSHFIFHLTLEDLRQILFNSLLRLF